MNMHSVLQVALHLALGTSVDHMSYRFQRLVAVKFLNFTAFV